MLSESGVSSEIGKFRSRAPCRIWMVSRFEAFARRGLFTRQFVESMGQVSKEVVVVAAAKLLHLDLFEREARLVDKPSSNLG